MKHAQPPFYEQNEQSRWVRERSPCKLLIRPYYSSCNLLIRRCCCAGLKTFLSVQSTRQLSEHTSAGLGVTWQPRAGLGLQLVSSRELTDTTSADFNWVIGPAGAAGAGLSISRRGEKLTTSGRIEVQLICHRGLALLLAATPCVACATAGTILWCPLDVDYEVLIAQQMSPSNHAAKAANP